MTNSFQSTFEIDETYENSQWLKTRIRTFAFGKNANGSDILNSSLTNFSKAHSSIGAMPVVARYNDEKDNLEGHNVILREDKNGEFEIFHDTDALGFTSPTATFYLEEVNEGTDDEPNFKTYVVIEDVYLWKRFDATKKIIEWLEDGISTKVSMEISDVEGQFDKDGYFQIHDFVFSGIAALGSDVAPCFPMAEIQTYSVNEFRQELKTLMSELNNFSNETKGGNTEMTKENKQENEVTAEATEVVKDYEKTEVEFEATETTENVKPEMDEQSEVSQVDETINDETQSDNADNSTETPENFEGDSSTEVTEENVVETDEAEVTSDETTEESEAVDYEAKFNELSQSYEQLKNDYASMKTELSEQQFINRQREEADLKAKFEGKLSDEEFSQVFSDMQEMDLDKVEEKLFALIGKKNFSIESTTTKTNVNKLSIVQPKDKKSNNPFDELIANYMEKQ